MNEKAKHPDNLLENERESVFRSLSKAGHLSSAASREIIAQHEDQIDIDFEHEKFSLENRKDKKNIRERWNLILTALVVSGFVLSYLMIALIGFGVMHFENNAFAVPSVVAAGVIQTYGLAKLAIQYFFSDEDRHTPKKK